jgi:alpha-L-arabinofuranosidase
MDRRLFLATLSAGLAPRSAQSANAEINVFPNETLGAIGPYLHGHFIEHLGGVIDDGVWVGENSPIANIGGVRKALVEAMLPLGSTVMRWPGGCFADSFDWQDGIGPRSQRPVKPNFWTDNGRLRDVPQSSPAKNDPPHVFAMYKAHQNARAVRAEFAAPGLSYSYEGAPKQTTRLAGSASVRGHKITTTAVNLSLTEALPARIHLHGAASARELPAVALTAGDIHAHHSFAQPDAVKPQPWKAEATGPEIRLALPPMSVVKIENHCRLGERQQSCIDAKFWQSP